MARPTTQDDLFDLLGGFCNQSLSEAESARLDEQLLADAAARETYLRYLCLESELHMQHSTPVAATEAAGFLASDELAADVLASDGHAAPDLVADHTASAQHFRPVVSRNWLAIAAALVGVAVGSSLLTYRFASQEAPLAEASPNETLRDASVARITSTLNCRWEPASAHLGFGAELSPGENLMLADGLAEITFHDGARVILEGPAELRIQAADDALLHVGRLAARVPEQARAFSLRTNRLHIVDLGTEFGLITTDEGGAEVHVFQGVVHAQVIDDEGQQVRTVALESDEAVRVRPASTTMAKFAASADQFVRSISPSNGPHDGLYAYEGFDYPAGPLAWQNGGFGWAGAWDEIEADNTAGAATNLVAEMSLTHGDMGTVGNRAVQTAQKNRVRRALSTSIGGVFDAAGLVENQDAQRLIGQNGKTVYVSFLQRIDATNDVFYGLELHRADGNPNRVLCVGNGADGCGYGVTSNYNDYGLTNYPPLGEETTDVNLIVLKIEFGNDNQDAVTVYRNPTSLVDEEASRPIAKLTGNFAFDRISLGNFDGKKIHEVDEIRVATNFLAATGRRDNLGDKVLPRVAAGNAKADTLLAAIANCKMGIAN
ncbi:MAG: FecR domain-containing protein [Pirellulales bacterium]